MAKASFFTVNGKKYKPIELDFNAVCDMAENGVSISDFNSKPMAAARAYFALYFGGDMTTAGREIQAHLVNGGKLDDVISAFATSIEESGFFQTFAPAEEETDGQTEEEETTEETK